MSARTKIVSALVDKLKEIDGTGTFHSNLFNNVEPKLKFWDEVTDFPYISVTAGTEQREYLPGGFKWGYLSVTLRIYVQDPEPEAKLEAVISDVESQVDSNIELIYDSSTGASTTDIRIISISTDEGLLAPNGVGEIVLSVQYEKQ